MITQVFEFPLVVFSKYRLVVLSIGTPKLLFEFPLVVLSIGDSFVI